MGSDESDVEDGVIHFTCTPYTKNTGRGPKQPEAVRESLGRVMIYVVLV
jgi:hypothetical protein